MAEYWEQGFADLIGYVDVIGDARVPTAYRTASGFRLGLWATKQRAAHLNATLSAERVARLETLVPVGWSWDVRVSQWEEGFARLEAFVGQTGRARAARSFKTADGYPLGKWSAAQRVRYKDGKLAAERAARLESLAGWTWEPWADSWEQGFAHLKQFVERTGTARVPVDFKTGDGYPLGDWVQIQYRRRAVGYPERDARLEALPGWARRAR